MAVITDISGPPSALLEQERWPRVAVLYASARGSTAGIAQRIAGRLRDAGTPVDVWPVEEVEDVNGYGAVVLGSAVYDGTWLAPAVRFARANADAIARRPLWMFSVGALDGPARTSERLAGLLPRDAGAIAQELTAVDHRRFAGLVERDRWRWWRRLALRLAGGRFGDRRDWAGIDAWAVAIARTLHGKRAE